MAASFLTAAEQRALDARTVPTATMLSYSPFARVLALLMAQHPRLGVDSAAAKLTADCAQRILLELTPVIVVDMGSGLCKAGFMCDERPSIVFPNIVGRMKSDPTIFGSFGDEALAARDSQRLRYPVEHGLVTNWEDAERVWNHLFYDRLRVRPADRPVLVTEPPLNPKASRERTAQIMFETFNVPAMYLSIGAILALYLTGRTSGLVVDSGAGVTFVVPIYEGYALPHAIQRVDLAGRDVDQSLESLLRQHQGRQLPASLLDDRNALEALLRDIKERHAHVTSCSREVSGDGGGAAAVKYALPGGGVLELGSELSMCMECLFDPSVIGFSAPGLGDVVYNAIMRTDVDLKKKMFDSIVLSGGTTMCRGFAERLHAELEARAPSSVRIKIVHAAADGMCANWAGGSRLVSLPAFQTHGDSFWVTRQDYDEEGPTIVHKKCFF